MNKSIFAIMCILGMLLLIYITTPSGYERELILKEKKYKATIDSIKTRYRELIHEDSITFVQYGLMAQRAIKAERDAKIWEKRYRHEKNNNRNFSDAAIDSLLAIVPGR